MTAAEAAAEAAKKTRAAQGLPPVVECQATLRRISSLVSSGSASTAVADAA